MPSVIALPGNSGKFEWAHFSRSGDTALVRRRQADRLIDKPEAFDNSPDSTVITAGKAVQSLLNNGYLVDPIKVQEKENSEWWGNVLKGMDEHYPDKASLLRIVPETSLRKKYEEYRKKWQPLRDDVSVRKSLLGGLDKLWKNSLEEFEPYNNVGEGWPDEDRVPLPDSSSLTEATDTRQVVATIRDTKGILDKEYIGREFSPRGTTKAYLECGKSAQSTGNGGADLFFRHPNGEPILGELKRPGDTCTAFALLQVMTYAAELATKNQLDRLERHVKQFSGLDSEEAQVHVLVLLANVDRNKDETIPDTINAINELNKMSLPRLGSVSIVQNDGEQWKEIQQL